MALTDNLISFWSLEEASGTRVDAVTATGNDLTDVNTVTSNPGIVGTAAQFTRANSEQLTRASNSTLALSTDQEFTWNVWVYLDSTAERLTFVNKYGGAGAETIAYLIEKLAAGNFRTIIGNGTTSVAREATTFGAPTTATWYMVTAWKTAATSPANSTSIAINAGTADSSALTGTVAEATIFRIGSRSGADFMNGRIDQVGFWKRALTSAERTQLYNGGAGLSYAAMVALSSPGGAGSAGASLGGYPGVSPSGILAGPGVY